MFQKILTHQHRNLHRINESERAREREREMKNVGEKHTIHRDCFDTFSYYWFTYTQIFNYLCHNDEIYSTIFSRQLL